MHAWFTPGFRRPFKESRHPPASLTTLRPGAKVAASGGTRVAEHALALHGFAVTPPAGWELAGISGHAGRGWLLLASERTPVVRVSWHRHAARPDLDRSLAGLGRMWERHHRAHLAVRTTPDEQQRSGEWDSTAGTWHAMVRWFPHAHLTITVAGLVPGVCGSELFAQAEARAEDQAWSWRCYGIDLELPPWWRLAGVQQYAGLTRALWHHRVGNRFRPDQVLVVRRLACASRLLAGGDLETWVRAGLGRQVQIGRVVRHQGEVRLEADQPATTWWRRWRGDRDRQVLHAWLEEEPDRLVLVEWRGEGEAPMLAPVRPVLAGTGA
jgi:hypothetical protein